MTTPNFDELSTLFEKWSIYKSRHQRRQGRRGRMDLLRFDQTLGLETQCHHDQLAGEQTISTFSLPMFDPLLIQTGEHGYIIGGGGSGKKTLLRDLYDKRLSFLYPNFYGNDMATRWGNDLTPTPVEPHCKVLRDPLDPTDILQWVTERSGDPSFILFEGFYSNKHPLNRPECHIKCLLHEMGTFAVNTAIWKCGDWLNHPDDDKDYLRWLFVPRQRIAHHQEKLWNKYFCHMMNLSEFRPLISTLEPFTFLVLDTKLSKIYVYRV